MKRISLAISLLVMLTLSLQAQQAKYVFYFIGDGMGVNQVQGTEMYLSELKGEIGITPLLFTQFPYATTATTFSATNGVTDSAAAGTALATGKKTKNGALGVTKDLDKVESVASWAKANGYRVGVSSSVSIDHATPAAFYAGVTSRSMTYDIAKQFTESQVDIAIGTGLEHFINRPDSLDLTAVLIEKGYDVYLNWESVLNTTSDKFVGILPFADVHRRDADKVTASAAEGHEVCLAAKMAAASGESEASHVSEPAVYLEKATAKALDVLSRDNENGFFLMVESAIIDGYGHNNDGEGLVEEMKEFDNTLRQLVEYVNLHPETLLVVTADHETGGTGITYNTHEVGTSIPLKLTFSTHGHTGTVAPVFAYGAGAGSFAGVMKNTDIPKRIEELMK